MFCLQRYWSLAELKQHVSSQHIRSPSSPITSEEDETHHKEEERDRRIGDGGENLTASSPTLPVIKREVQEAPQQQRRDSNESEGTDFISNLLGTKRAVVDRLLTTKSADDAAKLLGVR